MLAFISILPLLEEIKSPEERERLTDLFEKYNASMFAAAMKILNNEADAEDANFYAWEKIIKGIDKINMEQNPKGYLITSARNAAITLYHKKEHEAPEDPVFTETIPDIAPTIPEQIEGREDIQTLLECISRLSNTYREVMIMRYVSHLPIKQIAKISGLNVNTVKSRLSNGKKQLAQQLRELGYRVCLKQK